MARVRGHQNQTGTCAMCGGYDNVDDTFVNNIENFCRMYDIDVEAFSDFHDVDGYEEICEDCFLEMKAEFESESFKKSIRKIDNGLEQGIKEGYDNVAHKFFESTEEEEDEEELREIREAQMKILEKAKKIGHGLVDMAIKDMKKDLEGWDESTEESPAYILGVFMGRHRYAGKLYDGIGESLYDDYPC